MHLNAGKRALGAGLIALALCFILAGCERPAQSGGDTLAQPSMSPVSGASPSPSPTSSPAPSDEELASVARAAFGDAFRLDYGAYDLERDIKTVTELMELRSMFTGMAADYEAAVESAANAALEAVRQHDPEAALTLGYPPADWRFMVALSCDCAEKPEEKLLRLSAAEIGYAQGSLSVAITLPDFEEFFSNESGGVQYDALSIYCYLNTVYDIDGNETNSDGSYAFPEEYVASLVEPLPKRTLRPSWYNDRSNATRRHMGTDIRAPIGRIIHSISDGVVLYVGWTDIAGNYVMIRDDFGFRLTYCHMVEPTTHVKVGERVKAGDVIGNVGSTGNSDAPHLHLSVITPEYVYVDPYPLVRAIREKAGG